MEAGCPLCRDLGCKSSHKLGNFNCVYSSFPTRREMTGCNGYERDNVFRFGKGAYEGRRSYGKPYRGGISESDSYYYYD